MTIHKATRADIPHILNFIRKLAEFENLSYAMEATTANLRKYLFGKNPAAEVLIARLSGKPVAFALYFTTFSTFKGKPGIWLEDLFVLEEHRRVGIGRALVRALAKIAVQRKCARLEWVVLDWNKPAIRLYRKLGAIPMNEWIVQRVTGRALLKLAGRS